MDLDRPHYIVELCVLLGQHIHMLANREVLELAYHGRQMSRLCAQHLTDMLVQHHHRHLDPHNPISSGLEVADPYQAQVCHRVCVWHRSIVRRSPLNLEINSLRSHHSACIANAMVMLYVSRQSGAKADISYNVAWMGLWAYAEIGLGLIVICTLSLPKFIEVKRKKLRLFLSSITRPFSSSSGSWDRLRRSDRDVESGERDDDETRLNAKTSGSAKVYRLETLPSFNTREEMLPPPKAYSVSVQSLAERQS